MGDKTGIGWLNYHNQESIVVEGKTHNRWIGCSRKSPACVFCYAEILDGRWSWTPDGWGPGKERYRAAEKTLSDPLRWNRKAAQSGVRPRVFCSSLSDIFDDEVDQQWRDELWDVIAQTPHLDYLLLTKRPENIRDMVPASWYNTTTRWPLNVWVGTTAENQEWLEKRIYKLIENCTGPVRFLSCEPLLGPLDLYLALFGRVWDGTHPEIGCNTLGFIDGIGYGIDWVIGGGESGSDEGIRRTHLSWAQSLRDQCLATEGSTPFFWKQWGEWAPLSMFPQQRENPRAIIYEPTPEEQAAALDQEHQSLALPLEPMVRIGKNRSGMMLDGRVWTQSPNLMCMYDYDLFVQTGEWSHLDDPDYDQQIFER